MSNITDEPSIAHSIFSDKDLATHISSIYNLSVTNCQLVKPLVSTTYEVSTSENKYILRIYPHYHSTPFISSELDALLSIHQNGLNVSIPLPSSNGRYIVPIMAPEGQRQMVLFSFAEGIPLSREKNEIYFREFGRLVGSIHTVFDGQTVSLSRPLLDKAVLIQEPLEHISKLYLRYVDELQFLNKVAESITFQLETLSRKNLHYGFCHGDLNSFNVHVNQKGLLTLFDFEYCGLGWHAYDLATFINTETSVHTDLFLQGYQDVRPLTDEEKHFIPIFQIVQKIWMLGAGARVMHTMGTFMFTERLLKSTLDNIRNYQELLE